MSSTSDKLKGALNEATGSAKQAAGKVINSPSWKARACCRK